MRAQKGFSLIETMIAMVVLAVFGAALLGAVFTAHRSTMVAGERTTAESLARAQMEYIQDQPYNSTDNPPVYAVLEIPPSCTGYSYAVPMAVRLDPLNNETHNDDGVQKITVTVQRSGRTICTLEDYKVNK